jgi:polyphenol oxidase
MSPFTSALLAAQDGFIHGFGRRNSALTQDSMASLQQIHSNRVIAATCAGGHGEGDALVTATPGTLVSIRTADCLPILLADPRRGASAAIHAGWRGTAAGIVGVALARLSAEFGTRPEDVVAAIGPGIGACCYEVGLDVAVQLGQTAAGKVSLADINRRQLEQAGVMNIDVVSPCTFCNATDFYSYRREAAQAGRMISFIGRKT